MALNLIMLGPPGAGKGTQAERFARSRGIPKISTGDILRETAQAGTDLGRKAKEVMDRGELVSDDVMIGIVRERLERKDAAGGFVLDGFPRTVAQAVALDGMIAGRDPLIVIDIVVPEIELVRRLSARLVCDECGATSGPESQSTALDKMVNPGAFRLHEGSEEAALAVRATTEPLRCRRCGGRLVQRGDDSAAVVLERLRVYRTQTRPLVEFYKERPTFRAINGAQSPDRVAADLIAAIDQAGGVAFDRGPRR
jgi:adenylate kinase